MTAKQLSFIFIVLIFEFLVTSADAGSLEPPGKPAEPSSGMFTLEDVYNRLNSGVSGSKRTSGFVGPAAGPAVVGKTINEVMAIAPATQLSGATPADVACGKTFWGLKDGVWGKQTGTSGC